MEDILQKACREAGIDITLANDEVHRRTRTVKTMDEIRLARKVLAIEIEDGHWRVGSEFTSTEQAFIYAFNSLARDAHHTAQEKGWWKQRNELMELAKTGGSPELDTFARTVVKLSMVALEHSELSEGVEGIRKSDSRRSFPDDKIPDFSMEEAEAADTIIRLMDRGSGFGLRIAKAVVAKLRMNKTREHKHGGKTA